MQHLKIHIDKNTKPFAWLFYDYTKSLENTVLGVNLLKKQFGDKQPPDMTLIVD